MRLRLGEVYVHGRSRELARELIDTARGLGVHPHTVRAVDEGFIVPEAVADEVERQQRERWAPEGAVI